MFSSKKFNNVPVLGGEKSRKAMRVYQYLPIGSWFGTRFSPVVKMFGRVVQKA